jgi:hypothetical protein
VEGPPTAMVLTLPSSLHDARRVEEVQWRCGHRADGNSRQAGRQAGDAGGGWREKVQLESSWR